MNLSHWSIHHPKGIIMIVLALMLVGFFAFQHLSITLLPDIIYPDVRVRVLDNGVPSEIMEDSITKQLEEQLAITENAIVVRSHTSEGRSAVDLSFPYGTDINAALQDASSRLDRAKRFLPDSIDPPVIYKRDPSQIPVIELIVSSTEKSPVQLFQWADDVLSKWFINLPGVAAVETGGGLKRQIQVVIDQHRLANYGLDIQSLSQQIKVYNQNIAAGRLYSQNQEFSVRTGNQINSIESLHDLVIHLSPKTKKLDREQKNSNPSLQNQGLEGIKSIRLGDLAQIIDSHEDERLSIRLNGASGVKLSIQKQPSANTVAVVTEVKKRLQQLQNNHLVAQDINLIAINDQSIFIRYALNNAAKAAIIGTLLAMLVVFLFLADWRKTFIIGSAIPIAIFITFMIMDIAGLTLNIMTLGGLALGIGMLVDNTIVMLENINRFQVEKSIASIAEKKKQIVMAADEISAALFASTSTNLVAVLPFLFIGGLIGLFFKDLIITISAAIIASLLVSLTLVPSLAAKLCYSTYNKKRSLFNRLFDLFNIFYKKLINFSMSYGYIVILIFIVLFTSSIQGMLNQKKIFLPRIDEGRVSIGIKGEPGMKLIEMKQLTFQVESLLFQDPIVETVVSTIGGSVFGRSQYERSNRTTIKLQLLKKSDRQTQFQQMSSKQWIKKIRKKLAQLKIPGVKFWLRVDSVRGVRFGNSSEEIELRIQGNDIEQLSHYAEQLISEFKKNPLLNEQLTNLEHSYDEFIQELVIHIKHNRASDLGVSNEEIAYAVKAAISGVLSSNLIEGDKSTDIRIRLKKTILKNSSDLKNIQVKLLNTQPIYLRDVASIQLKAAPMTIERENQQRINEISASLNDDSKITAVIEQIQHIISQMPLSDGYTIYLGGNDKELREGQDKSLVLLILALFLVFTVLVIQYESLRNPLIILLGVPFTLTGVSFYVQYLNLPLSMPVWLGMIMLIGIVVNNSIVLLAQIELCKKTIQPLRQAIATAASMRLKAILMTSLTTVFGMLPLALGIGSGTEMLQPLAIVIVSGLSYSIFVSLLLVPNIYYLFYRKT